MPAAASRAREACNNPTQTQLKRDIVAAIKTVSQRLGNTPSVCRKCYIHPAILDAYLTNSMATLLKKHHTPNPDEATVLHPEETAMLYLLHQHQSPTTNH